MVAPQAMRTVWLALLCLIGLATGILVKMAGSNNDAKPVPSTTAEVARTAALTVAVARLSENLTARTKLQNSLTTTIDKLEVAKEAAPQIEAVKSIAIGLPTVEPKQVSKPTARIVTRHWHDPLDDRRAAARRGAKSKLTTRAPSAEASVDTNTKMPSSER